MVGIERETRKAACSRSSGSPGVEEYCSALAGRLAKTQSKQARMSSAAKNSAAGAPPAKEITLPWDRTSNRSRTAVEVTPP